MSESMFWDKRIAAETIAGVPFRMYTDRPHRLEEIFSFAECWGQRPFVIQGDRVVSFEAMQHATAAKAHELLDTGVSRGDRVFILGWNSPDWVINHWACIRIGAVPTLGNAWWSVAEFADALDLVCPALVLTDSHGAAKLPTDTTWPMGRWAVDEQAALAEPAPALPDPGALDENEPAAIIFTSGTSGRAKAVELAHRSLLSNQMMILHVTRDLPYQPDSDAGDTGLHTGPLFHIGGLHALNRALLVGNTLIFGEGKFDAGRAIELIERHRITRWSAVPTMVARVLEHPSLSKHDVSSLTAMTVGGSKISEEFFERVRQGLPSVKARIATGYGLSENGGQATTAAGKHTVERPGTAGRAMPLAEVRIVPQPNLPDGEVQVRSPTQMLRYCGVEESPIDAEGWLHTGDLGRMDDDGFIWITGRTKELIIRGGENIAPAAVEEALNAVSEVRECAVFGVPHAEFGEQVMAVVVTDADIDSEYLRQTLRGNLASFAIPTKWQFQSSPLPTNQTGKIDKRAVRQVVLAEHGETAIPPN